MDVPNHRESLPFPYYYRDFSIRVQRNRLFDKGKAYNTSSMFHYLHVNKSTTMAVVEKITLGRRTSVMMFRPLKSQRLSESIRLTSDAATSRAFSRSDFMLVRNIRCNSRFPCRFYKYRASDLDFSCSYILIAGRCVSRDVASRNQSALSRP